MKESATHATTLLIGYTPVQSTKFKVTNKKNKELPLFLIGKHYFIQFYIFALKSIELDYGCMYVYMHFSVNVILCYSVFLVCVWLWFTTNKCTKNSLENASAHTIPFQPLNNTAFPRLPQKGGQPSGQCSVYRSGVHHFLAYSQKTPQCPSLFLNS